MPVKRRKKVRKEHSIQVRVTEEQKQVLTDAATKRGMGVSTWLLSLGLEAARSKAS